MSRHFISILTTSAPRFHCKSGPGYEINKNIKMFTAMISSAYKDADLLAELVAIIKPGKLLDVLEFVENRAVIYRNQIKPLVEEPAKIVEVLFMPRVAFVLWN